MAEVVVSEHGGASVLDCRDHRPRQPGAGEVRIAVRAAGVNFADIEQRRGSYRGGPAPPFVPGLEAAGVVEATGPGVEEWTAGDEVVCFLPDGGGYAATAVADADLVFPRPDALSAEAAGGMLVRSFTAHNALHGWGALSADETVLVTAAAGGVGSAAVQLAARAGAAVVGVASTPEKRSFVADCGADHAVGYDAIGDLPAGVDGVDLLLDGVGGRPFRDGVEALNPGGRVVAYGVASGDVPTVATPRLFYGNQSVVGYHLLGGLRDLRGRVLAAKGDVYDAIAAGALSLTATGMALADAAAAHRAVEARETRGRLVLRP